MRLEDYVFARDWRVYRKGDAPLNLLIGQVIELERRGIVALRVKAIGAAPSNKMAAGKESKCRRKPSSEGVGISRRA